MTEQTDERVQTGFRGALRRFNTLVHSYPETPLRSLTQRDRALRRRRAKNKVARASRKTNRGG